jgi:hypothetical protein
MECNHSSLMFCPQPQKISDNYTRCYCTGCKKIFKKQNGTNNLELEYDETIIDSIKNNIMVQNNIVENMKKIIRQRYQ